MTRQKSDTLPDRPAGSPGGGEPVFLVVGKLRRPHGIHGEMIMDVYTDFPERLTTGSGVYIGEMHELKFIRSIRRQAERLLVALKGYDNSEQAGEFRNQLVFVRSDDRPPLPEGDYYHHQVVGLRVIDEAGNPLGVVTHVLETGANDIFVIQKESGPELLLPAIDAVLVNIDLAAGELRVHLLPGLLPEDW